MFNDSEVGPFEVLPGCTNVGVIRKPVSGSSKLYIYFSKSRVLVCSFYWPAYFYLLEKLAADFLKM